MFILINMKKILAIILLSTGLNAQTYLFQIQKSGTAGSVLTTTGTAGVLTYTNVLPIGVIPNLPAYTPTISGGYQPAGTYLTPTSTNTLTNKSGNISQWTNDAGYVTSTVVSGYVPTSRSLTINGTAYDLSANRTWSVGDALVANPLSQFAATTSSQLAGVINDETGTAGKLVFSGTPTFTTPVVVNGMTITAGSIPNYGIVIRDIVGTSTSGGIYISKTPNATNYSFGSDNAGNTLINWPTGSALLLQSNGGTTIGSVTDNRLSVQPAAATGGSNNNFRVLCPNSSSLTASVDAPPVLISLPTNQQYTGGNVGTLREVNITQPTVRFTSASTVSTVIGALNIAGAPIAGTNASYSVSAALNIESGSAVNAVGNATIATGIFANAPTGATSNYSGIFSGGLGVLLNATNLVTDVTTGLKIGTATTQKLGFFNATPIVQVPATTDLGLALSNLGLRAAGTAWPLTTSGAIAFSGAVACTNVSNTFKHIAGNQAVGTGTLGTGAGTSPTFTLTNCKDLSGSIQITTGTVPTALGTLITIPFGAAYVTNVPKVILTPRNKATQNLAKGQEVWPTTSLTQLILNSNDTALPATTLLWWDYVIVQ